MLGISENTVFKRLQRGRDQIEEYILRKKESKGDKTDE